MRKKTINKPTKTKPQKVKSIKKRKYWCPVNQCECIFEKCVACRTWSGQLIDGEVMPWIDGKIEDCEPIYKVFYCEHYKKEIKRVKL